MRQVQKELEGEREAKKDLKKMQQATITHKTLRRGQFNEPPPEEVEVCETSSSHNPDSSKA